MFMASRRVLAKAPVRPSKFGPSSAAISQARANEASNGGSRGQRGFRITPVGVAFILGGLAFASYMFKPTTRKPSAAMDTFKPQIAIVFGIGDSKGTFKTTASSLGFSYIDASQDLAKLDTLIQAGKTKFFIDGFKDAEALHKMSDDVVQPDLVMNFGKSDSIEQGPRVVTLGADADSDKVKELLIQKNLV